MFLDEKTCRSSQPQSPCSPFSSLVTCSEFGEYRSKLYLPYVLFSCNRPVEGTKSQSDPCTKSGDGVGTEAREE